MKKKGIYTLSAVLLAAVAATGLMMYDFGPGTTTLEKFFLVFFGSIIVLQVIPAALLFGCIIKEVFSGGKKAAIAESQSKSSV